MQRKILLLESDEQLCRLIMPLLQSRGHTVKCLSSGRVALREMDSEMPEIIIVGEQLDDIDGIGWIVKLRQQHKNALVAFVSHIWRDSAFYKEMTKELSVSQIFHRPIKSNLFGPQIESLWTDYQANQERRNGSLALPSARPEALVASVARANSFEAVTLPVTLPGGAARGASGDGVASIAAMADVTTLAFRQKFSKSIPGRVKQIAEILAKIVRDTPDLSLLSEARRLAHNLKGTSRSCGFDRVGLLAEKVEYSLRDILELPDVNVKLEWINIDDAIAAAEKESEHVRMQFMDYVPTDAELHQINQGSSQARVLLVSREETVEQSGSVMGGIPLNIVGARTTDEAMDKALRQQLDAALIEIQSDQKEVAFELARDLRCLVGYDNLPLGFISTHEDADRAEAAHAGASLVLEKPYEPDSLHKVLQHLITIREGGRWKVLLVDDDADFTEMVSSALGSEGMLVRTLNDPTNVLDVLDEFNPDLMLLDVMMPKVLGFDLCKKVRATGRFQDLPIIFLTAQTDLNSRLNAFDAGGDDYLPKPVINVELLKRVKIRLDRARMARERQDRDMLTGLLLRRAFIDQIDALISECERHNFAFTLCLLDIDHFKQVNDQHGHMAGDRVLAYLGKLLRRRFRVEDLRGRWGGEEFIMAFRHEKKEIMQKAFNRVLEELRTIEFKGDSGEPFFISFSAGMVEFPGDGQTIHDLVTNSDRRLYIAKENGRNQIVTEG